MNFLNRENESYRKIKKIFITYPTGHAYIPKFEHYDLIDVLVGCGYGYEESYPAERWANLADSGDKYILRDAIITIV